MSNYEFAATFSMMVASVIVQRCGEAGMGTQELYDATGISQSAWSRLARGQTSFSIEDLKIIEISLGLKMEVVIREAKKLEAIIEGQGVKIIRPYTTQSQADLADRGLVIAPRNVIGRMQKGGRRR